MSEKSVREMSALERKHNSLEVRVFRATFLNCFILGFVALIIGLVFYTIVSAQGYISTNYSVALTASSSAIHGTDGIGLSLQVMEIYRGLTDEERADPTTSEYRALFAGWRNLRTIGPN